MVGKGFSLKSIFLRGLKSVFLSGISCVILTLLLVAQSPAVPVESASRTIYVILGTKDSVNQSNSQSVTVLKKKCTG